MSKLPSTFNSHKLKKLPSTLFLLLAPLLNFSILTSSFAQTFPSGFSQVQVANGISKPTVLAFAPDGRIFVAEQGGKLRVIKNGSLLTTPFVQLSVNASGERGLIGIAMDPNFASNKYIYLYYTVSSGTIRNRVSRFTANGDVALSGSEKVLLELDPLSSATNHNGGAMQFGRDGKLYIAVGDNASGANAQNLDTYHGKILRINSDGSVPAGNPFTSGSEQKKRVWSYGLRNPYTFAFQPGTGRCFVNDVGQATWEEIDDATAGGLNFGWPYAEGPSNNTAYENPTYAYQHGSGDGRGCAITGGVFFNPTSTNYPSNYTGKYFYQDLCNDWINVIDISGSQSVRSAFASGLPGQSLSLSLGNDGNLYYLSRDNGALYKIIYTTTAAPTITSQPASVTVSQGQSATFSVSASGTAPLSYQWQKNGVNISGATGASYTIASTTTTSAGKYRAIVSNPAGSAISTEATLTVTTYNAAPTATITSPANHTIYNAGTVISFSGTGTDPEDGTLPASAFSWSVEFHHDTHKHDGPPVTSGVKSGSFTIPNQGETSVNVWYRLILTVTDSKGLTHRNAIDLNPRVVDVRLATNPTGLQLTLNNQRRTTPYSQKFVTGMAIPLSAPTPQTLNGVSYQFSNWSSGNSSGGNIIVPEISTTYTANFTAVTTSTCSATGTILREHWGGVSGSSVTAIPVNTSPSSTSQLSLFEAPDGLGSNYGARVRGYICPPLTGSYTFFIASDDDSELWLSSSDSPANKVKIASVTGWTHPRRWDKYASQKSAAVRLEAGKRYYIEALHKQGWGGDNLAVAWQLPDGQTEAPIPGNRLSPYSSSTEGQLIVREVWQNIYGTSVSDIPTGITPSTTSQLTLFEAPTNAGDNYGARVRAYVHAPVSGSYTFWISSDDYSELWLSTDSNPANKQKVGYVNGNTGSRQWDKYTSQKSGTITLQAGQKYYIEALHKEGIGVDHLAVAWQLPNGTREAPIPASRLSAFILNQATTAQAMPANEHELEGPLVDYYPNPFLQEVILQLRGKKEERYQLQLFDVTGREVWQLEDVQADQKLRIGMELHAGVYIMLVSTGKETKQYKLVKAR